MALTQSDHSGQRVGFWDLPLEIRNKVYYDYFGFIDGEVEPYPNYFEFKNGKVEPHPMSRRGSPISPLLQTCQVVYSEATMVLYSQSRFYLSDFDGFSGMRSSLTNMGRWLGEIGSTNRSRIRHLHFHFEGRNNGDAYQLRRQAPFDKTACCPAHGLEAGLAQLKPYRALQTINITFELPANEPQTEDILALSKHLEREYDRATHAQKLFASLFLPGMWMKEMLCGVRGLENFHVDHQHDKLFGKEWKKLEIARQGVEEVKKVVLSPWVQEDVRKWQKPCIGQSAR